MATHFPSHLHKNRYGVYGFRIVIPRDLRLSFPKNEIRISLRTTRKSEAKPYALRLSLLTTDYFSKIRGAPTFEEALANGEELLQVLGGTAFDDLTEKLRVLIPLSEGESTAHLHRLISLRTEYSSTNEAKLSLLQATVAQLPGKSDAEIDSLFCDLYAEITPLVIKGNALSAELNDLTLASQKLLQNNVHALEVQSLQDSQKAELSSVTEIAAAITLKAAQMAVSASSAGIPTRTSPTPKSEQLATVVEEYCANQIREGCWTLKTEAENRAIFALWLRISGDQPIHEYGFEQHRSYKTKLVQLPPNLNKNPSYRDKSISEVLAMNCLPAAPNTVNKNLVRISALFDWAINHGFTDLNPASGMTIRNPKRANEERKAFSDNDLSKLFGSREYAHSEHRHPYQFWVPLIALHFGARLNEICQLHLCDFLEDDGVKVIRISEEGGKKRLKTKAARRLIPLHPELVRLGLLEFVTSLRQQGEIRLFPELIERRDGYGQAASKWFASYCTRCGVDEPGKVFHSFRHTVIDRLKQSDVSKEKIAALVGHEDDSVTFGRYGKDFNSRILHSVVVALKYDVVSGIAPKATEPNTKSNSPKEPSK